jgi:hypothetical protein
VNGLALIAMGIISISAMASPFLAIRAVSCLRRPGRRGEGLSIMGCGALSAIIIIFSELNAAPDAPGLLWSQAIFIAAFFGLGGIIGLCLWNIIEFIRSGSKSENICKGLLFITLFIVFLRGCEIGPVYRPSEKAVIGTYTLTKKSISYLSERMNYPTIPDTITITLTSDHTAIFTNLPDCALNGYGEPGGNFINHRGTWKISKGAAFLDRLFDGWPVRTDYVTMYLKGIWAPYQIYIIVGDPDGFNNLIYEKK